MKRPLLLAVPAVLAVLTAAFVPPSAPQDPKDTQLALYMKDINQGLRRLRGALRDPAANAESVAAIRTVQDLVLKSRAEKPAALAEAPEAERDAFLVRFQKQMVDLHRGLLDLEVLVLDGDNDGAQEQLRVLNEMKSEAHKVFRVKD